MKLEIVVDVEDRINMCRRSRRSSFHGFGRQPSSMDSRRPLGVGVSHFRSYRRHHRPLARTICTGIRQYGTGIDVDALIEEIDKWSDYKEAFAEWPM